MNRLKNKDGSAILWTVLLTVIITILLGSLLTLSYGYHNSTIATVTKQQAYFTARSATDAIIAEIGTNGLDSNLMPKRNGSKIEVKESDFNFTKDMGKAKAEIRRVSDDTVEVKVVSTYADSNYNMTATLKNQSLFFGGIAIKKLTVPSNSTFVLDDNTDLYIDDEAGFSGRLDVGGNLICKGNINLLAGSKIAGQTFTKNATFDANNATTNPRKQIWSSTKYIISNYTMNVNYPDFVQTNRMLVKSILKGNYDREGCNNVYGQSFNPNLLDNFDLTKFSLVNSNRYIKITNFDSITGRYFAEQGQADRAYVSVNNYWIPFYKGWKISEGKYTADCWEAAPPFGVQNTPVVTYNAKMSPGEALNFWWRSNVTPINPTYAAGLLFSCDYFLRNDTYDVNQIKYSSSSWTSATDDVTSVAYVLIDKDCKMRIRYGLNEEYGGFVGTIKEGFDAMLQKKITYIYFYLGEGAVLELGNNGGTSQRELNRLNFFASVYGVENSKLILHNNVKLHGSVNVDTLEIRPGASASVNYVTSNGGQVAKQKVDELWTISNYTDK